MRRARLNTEQREKLFSRIDKKNELEKRKTRLYNRRFRKTPLFIVSWLLRLIYIGIFVSISFINDISNEFTEEVVLEKEIIRTSKHTILNLKTDKGNYSVSTTRITIPRFNASDTILVERNIFNKPVYFTRQGWIIKYAIQLNAFYYFILFPIFISLFFNNGLEKFTKRLLLASTLLSVAGPLCYLLG
jgi:hypothetical protein